MTSRGRAVRVGIIALLQESNTFIDGRTTLAHFEQDVLCDGEEVRRRFEGTHHEVGGFFQGLADEGIDAVPIFAARALPYGMLTAETFETLLVRMDAALAQAGPLDGLLVAPHGATVCETVPDVDGSWLEMLRCRVGPQVPIIGTLDLHANLSPRMVAACNALIAYRTNPHLDQRERGVQAARLMARTLRGEVRPTMAAAFLPLAVNIERQSTADGPCQWLYEQDARVGWHRQFVTTSCVLGFPYADVAEMGAARVVVTDGDPTLARAWAQELSRTWWDRRYEFRGQLICVKDAVARAATLPGPVCLLDMGDNVGGGSPGDGTILLRVLMNAGIGSAFGCLYDPIAYTHASSAGVTAQLPMAVGAHTDRWHGKAIQAEFTVRGLYSGQFEEAEVRHGGLRQFDQGPTAVVETAGGLTIMVTSKRMVPFSLQQLSSCGIDPTRFRVLVAKGVHAPVAAYAPVCKHLIRVNTPGVTTADLSQLDYRHRRRPMFPFEPDMQWSPDEITMGHQHG
jgi:microcystin degradation protein MlrC